MADETNELPPVTAAAADPPAPKCPYCLAVIEAGDEVEACSSCRSRYHRDCWQENGGCAVYGCARVPPTESRGALEVPLSYWGQENKPCPSCGGQILAAAVRCRHCGATFSSAQPQNAGDFEYRAALKSRLPAARKQVIAMFILSVVPFTAPAGAIWALIWRPNHADELAALPPLYGALHRIGFAASITLTGALLSMTALYVLVRGH